MKKLLLFLLLFFTQGYLFSQYHSIVVSDAHEQSGDTINTCQDTITFSVDRDFTSTFDDSTSIFTWDFGDGSDVETGAAYELDTIVYTYDEGGSYYVTLIIEEGTTSSSAIRPVRVSMIPKFDSTEIDIDHSICLGDTIILTGAAVADTFKYKPDTMVTESSAQLISDDYSYSSTITHNFYDLDETLKSADSLESVCINIEHSNMSDLQITLSCPNGTTVILKEYGGIADTYLGEPVDNEEYDSSPGTGYDYCWNNDPYFATMNEESGIYTFTYTDVTGVICYGQYHLSDYGSYASSESLDKLAGCPINGDWTITVTDSASTDNGYIYSWSLIFPDTIESVLWNWANTYSASDGIWDGDEISATSESVATAIPTEIGNNYYTYQITDDFGCAYDTTIIAEVTEALFTASSVTAVAGVSIEFESDTEWAVLYNWDYGDDETLLEAVEDTCSHAYEKGGYPDSLEYVVILEATSDQGCVSTDTVSVFISAPDSEFELKNIFTPNGDGINDYFQIEMSSSNNQLKSFDGRIFSRYGNRIFKWTEWEGENTGWDGKIGNRDAAPGVYFYVIIAEGEDGQTYKEKGFFYLMRDK